MCIFHFIKSISLIVTSTIKINMPWGIFSLYTPAHPPVFISKINALGKLLVLYPQKRTCVKNGAK